MRDVLLGRTNRHDTASLSADHRWALTNVKVYYYRKLFGLSYEDFMREPMDQYIVNSLISSQINTIHDDKAKKLERKAKLRHGANRR